MPSGRRAQVLIIVGMVVLFGMAGVVGAAYAARDILRLPGTAATRAGPAWLFSGLGVGAILGALLAVGLSRPEGRYTEEGRTRRSLGVLGDTCEAVTAEVRRG